MKIRHRVLRAIARAETQAKRKHHLENWRQLPGEVVQFRPLPVPRRYMVDNGRSFVPPQPHPREVVNYA